MRLLISLVICFWATLVIAQPEAVSVRYARTITKTELKEHLEVLASDSFMGRDTGKAGQKLAAAYLREHFRACGIPPLNLPGMDEGYYQPYRLVEERKGSISVQYKGRTLEFLNEVLYLTEEFTGSVSVKELQVLRANALRQKPKSAANHILLQLAADVAMTDLRPILEQEAVRSADIVLVVAPDQLFEQLQVFVHPEGSRMRLADEMANHASKPNGSQILFITQTTLEKIAGAKKAKGLHAMPNGSRLKTKMLITGKPKMKEVIAENVLAYIEGSDKKDEHVIITAHYDHIGVEGGVVYNGADDDGSGTVALMEIAEALALAKAEGYGPRRSILIMPVSGEEKGLLGSRFYSDHPVLPLEKAVANLNIDMIGRTDSAHAEGPPYVYVIGSDRLSSDLHAVNEAANKDNVGIELDYAFNAADDPNRFYYRSDHYNFARKGIPCIFYFSGVHEDYHQPGDDVEKIRFDLLERRTRLVFHTAWELANREDRIRIDKPTK